MNAKDRKWIEKAMASPRSDREVLKSAHVTAIRGETYAVAADGFRAHYLRTDEVAYESLGEKGIREALESFIITGNICYITVNAFALYSAFDRALAFARNFDNAGRLRCVARSDKIEVAGLDIDGNEVVTTLTVRTKGYEFPGEIRLDCSYMRDALKGFEGEVELHFSKSQAHVMLCDSKRERIAIIMPRIKDNKIVTEWVPMHNEDAALTTIDKPRRVKAVATSQAMSPWYARVRDVTPHVKASVTECLVIPPEKIAATKADAFMNKYDFRWGALTRMNYLRGVPLTKNYYGNMVPAWDSKVRAATDEYYEQVKAFVYRWHLERCHPQLRDHNNERGWVMPAPLTLSPDEVAMITPELIAAD